MEKKLKENLKGNFFFQILRVACTPPFSFTDTDLKIYQAIRNALIRKKTFSCKDLSMQDIRRFHEAFYSNATKVEQDNFILKHTA